MYMIMIFEDIDDVKNENYKGNDEEDHEDKDDGDEAKLVLLTQRNEKCYNYDDDNFIILIFLMKMMINYMKAKPHGYNISTNKIF